MALLETRNLQVRKPGNPLGRASDLLVDNTNIEVSAGEILAIIGPNGAGKSTLLKAIAGDWDFQGELLMPSISSTAKLRARQLGVLPQFSLLNFPYRVNEVVELGRIPHQTGSERDREIVQQALAMMDIDYLSNRLYPELSGGEKQRVQLARVLTQIWDAEDAENGARLLLLDEPTTALDLGHQSDLMSAVRSFADQGVAVIMVMHDINLASRHADKMLAMLCSQTIAYGSRDSVITAENINRLFNVDVQIIEHPADQSPLVVGL